MRTRFYWLRLFGFQKQRNSDFLAARTPCRAGGRCRARAVSCEAEGGVNKEIYPPIRQAKNNFLLATFRPSKTGEGNKEIKEK